VTENFPPRSPMTRYTMATGPETEYEPRSRSRVLRNKLGLTSKAAMDKAEAEALGNAHRQYLLEEVVTARTRFTARLIKRMHRDWLGSLYEWAGSYRTVDMSKGDFVFPPAYLVSDNMREFERGTLRALTPCRPGNTPAICEAVAQVHAELLLIHPFREGNGRLARWLATLMFVQAGKTLPDYGFVGRGSTLTKTAYLEAVIRGYYGDYSDLALFFEGALERGYAADLSFTSERGDAPSKMEDS
jgi:cell filamentation protein